MCGFVSVVIPPSSQKSLIPNQLPSPPHTHTHKAAHLSAIIGISSPTDSSILNWAYSFFTITESFFGGGGVWGVGVLENHF